MSFQRAKQSILKGSLKDAIRDGFALIGPFLGPGFDPTQKEPVLIIKALAIRIREWSGPPDDARKPSTGDMGWPTFSDLRTSFYEGPIRFLWAADDALAKEPDRDQRLERLVEVLRTRTEETLAHALYAIPDQVTQLEDRAASWRDEKGDSTFYQELVREALDQARRLMRIAVWLLPGRSMDPWMTAFFLEAAARYQLPLGGHSPEIVRRAAVLAEELGYVCPRCESADVADIVYGFLTAPLPPPKPGERKKYEGGCRIGDATRRCCACEHAFAPLLAFDDVLVRASAGNRVGGGD